MIWFKHLTTSSAQNQIVSKVQQKFGLEGYARLYILIETIVSQMEDKEDDASVEYPVSKWCETLKCKKKVLRSFFIHLQEIGAIKFVGPGNAVKVTFLKLSKLLDNRAVSSQLRRPSGGPRTDQRSEKVRSEKQEQKIADDAETDFSWLTEILKGGNVKHLLPSFLTDRWLKNGFDDAEFSAVRQRIRQQFSSNEKSQGLGEVIINSVEKVAAMIEAIEEMPQSISGQVETEFLIAALRSIHVDFEKDENYQRAVGRCKDKTVTATDIAYIRTKAKHLNILNVLKWIPRYEKQLVDKFTN